MQDFRRTLPALAFVNGRPGRQSRSVLRCTQDPSKDPERSRGTVSILREKNIENPDISSEPSGYSEGLTKLRLNVNIINMLIATMESIINIIYPPICRGCNRPNYNKENDGYICNECYYGIKRHTPPFCLKCGRGLTEIKSMRQGVCSTCLNRQYYFEEAWSLCSYEGIIKDLIHRFKYSQKIQYKTIFQNLFKEFLKAFNILRDIDLIIPIPLHPTRLREREYNQSQILASIVSETIHKPMASDILIRLRNTKSQIDLDEKTRIKNITGCFAVKNRGLLKSKSVLLIDDVLTTGVTLSEAAKVIKEFNPRKISALTLAS